MQAFSNNINVKTNNLTILDINQVSNRTAISLYCLFHIVNLFFKIKKIFYWNR